MTNKPPNNRVCPLRQYKIGLKTYFGECYKRLCAMYDCMEKDCVLFRMLREAAEKPEPIKMPEYSYIPMEEIPLDNPLLKSRKKAKKEKSND